MQLSYLASPIHQAAHQIINRALTHFAQRFDMTRPGAPHGAMTKKSDIASQVDVAIEDWDVMFNAVKTRLTQIAEAQPLAVAERKMGEPVEQLRMSLLQCVAALEQLHVMARDERVRR